jgi:hypothetical protein
MSGKGWAVLPSAAAAFWTYVVLDFAIHAVVLASWWRDHGTFSLSLLELAQRIPIGYASFAIYCVGLCWLLATQHFGEPGVLVGLRVGALAGIAYGVMFGLGVYSIARIPASFLVLGPASTAVCSAGAGGAGAWALGGRRWRRLGLVVLGGVVVLILAIVAQNMLQIYPAESPALKP